VNIAARQSGVGRLGAHLDALDIEPVLVKDLPLLRRKQSEAADRSAGIRYSDFCFSGLALGVWREKKPKKRRAGNSRPQNAPPVICPLHGPSLFLKVTFSCRNDAVRQLADLR
jgi:hypothetical protein